LEADETFKKRYGPVYKELTAGKIETNGDPDVKGVAVSYRPAFTFVTEPLMDPYASFVMATYPLKDSTI